MLIESWHYAPDGDFSLVSLVEVHCKLWRGVVALNSKELRHIHDLDFGIFLDFWEIFSNFWEIHDGVEDFHPDFADSGIFLDF